MRPSSDDVETKAQAVEIERLRDINRALVGKSNGYVVMNAKLEEERDTLRTHLANLRWDLATAKDALANARADVARLQDIVHGREAIDKLNTDQMQRDTKLIERLRTDVALLRDALAALQDATSHIPGHHGPDVWRVVESARQALERTCRD